MGGTNKLDGDWGAGSRMLPYSIVVARANGRVNEFW